jgi:hypothetical protein
MGHVRTLAFLTCSLGLALGAAACDSSPSPAVSAKTDASPAAAAPAGHVQIEDAPPTGDVEPLVRAALSRASSAKRRLIVYAGAKWCEPCQRFHHAAEQGELDASFPDLNILVFDMDRDGERLASAGYVSKYIPLFALPAADGSSSGKQVEGGVKGDGAVAYLTPRLKGLLQM